ncbi:MAG: hypothetical protein H6718_36710 [Polyangiaceae bacterium]|nr:hypothetical protein [Polyangiaceae bacterium]
MSRSKQDGTVATSAVVVGLGQLGAVFAEGWLKAGRAVVPITRSVSLEEVSADIPRPAVVLVAVGEAALPALLEALPPAYRERAALVQNELLPRTWRGAYGAEVDPNVAVVWFEKKPGKLIHSIRPSVLHGPQANILAESMGQQSLPYFIAESEAQRDFELVLKNLYILALNLGGLAYPCSAGELWRDHQDLMGPLADELITLQAGLLGRKLDRAELLGSLERAIAADPTHGARGRTAEERLGRAAQQAAELGLQLPVLSALAAEHLGA